MALDLSLVLDVPDLASGLFPRPLSWSLYLPCAGFLVPGIHGHVELILSKQIFAVRGVPDNDPVV